MKQAWAVFRLLATLLLAIGWNAPAHAGDPARVGDYDFGYLLGGDARAKPVQVFDDGHDTFFQFRAGEPVPAIFAQGAGAPRLLVPAQEGPYVRVPQLHGRFLLQVGRAQANVVHAGGDRADAPAVTTVAANGMSAPYAGSGHPGPGGRLVASLAPVGIPPAGDVALDRHSYATPLKGDRVYWPERSEEVEHAIGFQRGGHVLPPEAQKRLATIATGAAPAARFLVIGRDDDSYKEGLERARAEAIRHALVKSGIAAGRITVRTGVARPGESGSIRASTLLVQTPERAPVMRASAPLPAPSAEEKPPAAAGRAQLPASLPPEAPDGGFTLTPADRTISGAVRRWAQALKYQVVWDAPAQLDAAISGEARLAGQSLPEAMDHLVRGLLEKGYALEVTIYANRVIRFTAPPPVPATPATGPGSPLPLAKPLVSSY